LFIGWSSQHIKNLKLLKIKRKRKMIEDFKRNIKIIITYLKNLNIEQITYYKNTALYSIIPIIIGIWYFKNKFMDNLMMAVLLIDIIIIAMFMFLERKQGNKDVKNDIKHDNKSYQELKDINEKFQKNLIDSLT